MTDSDDAVNSEPPAESPPIATELESSSKEEPTPKITLTVPGKDKAEPEDKDPLIETSAPVQSAKQRLSGLMAAQMSAPNEKRSRSCCGPVFEFRRRIAPYFRMFQRTRSFQTSMFAALLSALFLPDIWILLDIPTNRELDVILTVVLFAFLVELVVQSIGHARTYLGSFFFWMDLMGAVSLLLDLSYIPIPLGAGSDSSAMSNNVVLMRAARIAKLGARAGRFTRLVKLLRFLPGMKAAADDAGTAKVISSRLINALSTRVSCLIIIMVMVMPMFSMWTYPEQDWSVKSWLDILQQTAQRHPQRFPGHFQEFVTFYKDMDYYPYRVEVRSGVTVDAIVTSTLPYVDTDRGKPQRERNLVDQGSDYLDYKFSYKKPYQVDSLMNVLLLLVVMFLMVGFSLVLTKSVTAIVSVPLEKLLDQVKKIAATIFQSVADMQSSMEGDYDESNSSEEEDGEGGGGRSGGGFGHETELLEKVVHKLGVLSELTMHKSAGDTEGMDLSAGEKAVIDGFQGGAEVGSAWVGEDDENEADANHESILASQRAMIENAGLSLDLLNSWNLNPLELDRARNMAASMYFIGPHNHGIPIDAQVVAGFLEHVESAYLKSSSYHNWFHAVDVGHAVFRFLHICSAEAYLSNNDRFALLVSAIAHDVAHPGLNNTFLVETSHELALRYNDRSPLENMHCAKLFEFATVAKCNIFASFPKPQFQEVRKICIDAIFNTDNALHFAMIKEVQMIYEMNSEILDATRDLFNEDPEEFPTKEAVDCFRQGESRKLIVKMFLHLADISNSLKPFRICRIWAWQVLEELFSQGDQEKRLEIPVQPLNDREKVNRSFSQVGFIEFLVSPLLLAVMKVLPPMEGLAEQMLENMKMWTQNWPMETKPPPSDQEKKVVEDRIVRLEKKVAESRG